MPRCPVKKPGNKGDCSKEIPPERVMCADDWRRVPYALQTTIWANYTRGQNAMTASKEYKAARQAALNAAAKAREEEAS